MRFIHDGITYVYGEDLSGIDLRTADFSSTVFRHCNLEGAKLPPDYALRGLQIGGIRNCIVDSLSVPYGEKIRIDFRPSSKTLKDKAYNVNMQIYPSGELIGYKTVLCITPDYFPIVALATLLIPADQERIIYEGDKCRAERVAVLSIEDQQGNKLHSACSFYDREFIYSVGCIAEADSFNDNPLDECSHGIHFFLTKKEAIEYGHSASVGIIIGCANMRGVLYGQEDRIT